MRKLNLNVNVAAILKNGYPLEIVDEYRVFPKEWALGSICAKFHACIPERLFQLSAALYGQGLQNSKMTLTFQGQYHPK